VTIDALFLSFSRVSNDDLFRSFFRVSNDDLFPSFSSISISISICFDAYARG